MQIIPFDDKTRAGWKSYPVRVQASGASPCCALPMLLVQSMQGGFVTQNCSKCGEFMTLSEAGFLSLDLWVSCPRCRKRMTPQLVSKNYGYRCAGCDVAVLLAALLPRWQDLE